MALSFSCRKKEETPLYNIILITVDALRADHMGAYGYPFNTSPNMDALAEKSVLFEFPYCTIPKTSASVASLLTGLHPFQHMTNPNRSKLLEQHITLTEALKMRGYFNWAVVDNGNLSKRFNFNQGFDQYNQVWDHVEEKEESTPFITETVLDFLERDQREPFFMWAHYIETHSPYIPPEEFIEERPKGRIIKELEHRIIAGERPYIDQGMDEGYLLSLYDGAVKYIDHEIGTIIDLIFDKGLHENSIIIISSDHGEELGEYNYFYNHGALTFNSSTRVPLIFFAPHEEARRIRYPVSLMDVYPTLLDLAGLDLPYDIQGINLFKYDKDRKIMIWGRTKGYESFSVVYRNFHYVHLSDQNSRKLNLEKKYFFDIFQDPYEQDSILSLHTKLAESLDAAYRTKLDEFFRNMKGRANEEETGLSEKEIKNLKTLGYIK